MKICNFDILFIILIVFISIFVYDQIKNLLFFNENFQTTGLTGYQADVEAIRNLSNIATQLTSNNTLTMPGALTVTSNLTTSGNLVLDGDNKWIIHTPDDGRKTMYIAPWNGRDNWDFSKQLSIDNSGNTTIAGNSNISGNTNIGGITSVKALYTSGGTNNNPGGNTPSQTHFPWLGDGNNYIRGNTILDGNLTINGNLQFGGRSNIASIFCGSIKGNCGNFTTVTHNKGYTNPAKLSIQLLCSRITQGDMFVANLAENNDRSLIIDGNSFTFYTFRLNTGCGSIKDPTVHYTIFEYL